MPFLADWMEEYALLWVRDKISPVLAEAMASQEVAKLQKQGILLWPLLSEELREKILAKAHGYGATIVELDADRVVDELLEAMQQQGMELDREWAKQNLLAFKKELEERL